MLTEERDFFNKEDVIKKKVVKKKVVKKKIKRDKFSKENIFILAFSLTFISIAINNYIYKKNDKILEIKNEMEKYNKENDNLMLQISKISNISNVINSVQGDLGMCYPKNEDAIYIDTSIEYFSHLK